MPIILKQFEIYLRERLNYSEQTVNAYINDLLLFFEFLKNYNSLDLEIKDFNIFILGNVKEHTIYAFLVYLNNYRNNTASSRKRRLACLKTFFRWLYRIKEPTFSHKQNPLENISSIPQMVRLPKYLSLEQAKKLQNIFTTDNCRNPLRNNTIITVFLNTGIRISELISLNISDIDFVNRRAIIMCKGRVERYIFFSKAVINRIKEYIDTRKDDNEALFISSLNKRISKDTITNICKRAFELIGIEDTKGYSAHTLRHTSATVMYKTTKDLLLTSEFLGHKHITTTEIYTHIENEDVRNAVLNNPLSKFGL